MGTRGLESGPGRDRRVQRRLQRGKCRRGLARRHARRIFGSGREVVSDAKQRPFHFCFVLFDTVDRCIDGLVSMDDENRNWYSFVEQTYRQTI